VFRVTFAACPGLVPFGRHVGTTGSSDRGNYDIADPVGGRLVVIAACAVTLIARANTHRKPKTRLETNEDLLALIVARQSSEPPSKRPTGGKGGTSGERQCSPEERHLRITILDVGARERLIQHAMRMTGDDRIAAIRKVLLDLEK
jgi:hypothetical protein